MLVEQAWPAAEKSSKASPIAPLSIRRFVLSLLLAVCTFCLFCFSTLRALDLTDSAGKAQRQVKRNLVFMVSDGMGPASLVMTRNFLQHRDGLSPYATMHLDEQFIGNSRTWSDSSLVTDSAAGATAFSCILKTYNGAVGVDSNGVPCGTVLEAAKRAGYMTGLVVTTRVTDATPASFAAHATFRSQEDYIAEQLVGLSHPLGRVVDLIIGGGRCHFVGKENGGCRADNRNLLEEAAKMDWTYYDSYEALATAEMQGNVSLPILNLLEEQDIAFQLDRAHEDYGLPQLVDLALQILSRETRNSPKGFFLLVEGSRIDHAGHDNDPAAQVREVEGYDTAFHKAVDFAKKCCTQTVVVSTSDHETGGLSVARQITKSYPDYLWKPEVLKRVKHSAAYLGQKLAKFGSEKHRSKRKLIKYIEEEILGPGGLDIEDIYPNETSRVLRHWRNAKIVLANIVSKRAQIGWATQGHSAVEVNVYGYARDPQILDQLRGGNENINIGRFLGTYLGVNASSLTEELRASERWVRIGAECADGYHILDRDIDLDKSES